MVEKKGRPPGKNGKRRKNSIFTVFTADMVEKKGAPPPVKNGKRRTISIFTVFTADMVEKKGPPPVKTAKK